MFVIDTNKEAIAIAEARKLASPVVADPRFELRPGRHQPTRSPAMTTRRRAITLYCDLIARAVIDGIERAQGAVGIDLGAAEQPVDEPELEGEDPSERPAPRPDRRKKPARSEARGPGNGKGRPDNRRGGPRKPRPAEQASGEGAEAKED